ncbi:chloride channel protein [Pedobacter sp. ASV1-7]|uniref:chloride channel protein n=1 Tax=Pedobacter sp. ASV1-7 TaxID=3145237 RepID=UPI0032E934CA
MAWWLVNRYAPYAKGSGIPQVMAAINISSPVTDAKVNQLLSLRVALVKGLNQNLFNSPKDGLLLAG